MLLYEYIQSRLEELEKPLTFTSDGKTIGLTKEDRILQVCQACLREGKVTELKRMEEFLEKGPEDNIYVCPECHLPGIPSIYGDYCTDCSNRKRGF